jgi:DNA modification methylase
MVADKLTWKKKSALPNNVSHNKLTRICEEVFVFCRKDEYKTFYANKEVSSIGKNGQTFYKPIYNFIEAANNDGSCKLNKARYSSELCVKLLNIYAPSNAVVFDPFMGSGTTGIACEMLGFNCIGTEISEAQVEYSYNRLKEYKETI